MYALLVQSTPEIRLPLYNRGVTTMRHLRQVPPRSDQEVQSNCSKLISNMTTARAIDKTTEL